jgi:hypothetical protein
VSELEQDKEKLPREIYIEKAGAMREKKNS